MLPILYQGHSLVLYSYPLLMGLGWGVAYQIFFSLIANSLPQRQAQLLFWGIFLFSWIGSKLMFLYTVPELESAQLMGQMSFWTGGGFVFYGGLLASLVFLGFYRFLGGRLNPDILWSMVTALTFGHAIGRVGCFLAGCCYGKPTEFWWGIHLHGADRHPTQLLEAGGLLLLGYYLFNSHSSRPKLLCHYLIGYGILRCLIEGLRGDLVRGQWGFLSPSQWISFVLITIGLSTLVRFKLSRT